MSMSVHIVQYQTIFFDTELNTVNITTLVQHSYGSSLCVFCEHIQYVSASVSIEDIAVSYALKHSYTHTHILNHGVNKLQITIIYRKEKK